jgi:hypothetical protein
MKRFVVMRKQWQFNGETSTGWKVVDREMPDMLDAHLDGGFVALSEHDTYQEAVEVFDTPKRLVA